MLRFTLVLRPLLGRIYYLTLGEYRGRTEPRRELALTGSLFSRTFSAYLIFQTHTPCIILRLILFIDYLSIFTSPEETNCFSIITLMIIRENKIIE